MKLKKLNISSQLLILLLAALVMGFMLQVAHAQGNMPFAQTPVLQTQMPQQSLARTLMQNTSLNYYTQFLGPTVGGPGGQSYNVYQEGNTPYQSFHAGNIRYQFNPDWAAGVSLAAVNAYGETVTSQQNGSKSKMLRDEFFNARAFVSLPSLRADAGTLFTNLAYEAPTSNVAKQDEMKFGLVLSQSYAFKLPSIKWTTGVAWQYYRAFYQDNVVGAKTVNGEFGPYTLASYARQTTIFNIGPYLAYRFSDAWGATSSMTFDWDQRGNQTGTGSWNNNIPDRARVGISYYPTKIKQIQNIGLFTQGLIKYTTASQALGMELAASF
jgi:hypothetical protein